MKTRLIIASVIVGSVFAMIGQLAFASLTSQTVPLDASGNALWPTSFNVSGTISMNGVNVMTATSTPDNYSAIQGSGMSLGPATIPINYGTGWATSTINTGGTWAVLPFGNGITVLADNNDPYRSTDYGADWTDLGSFGAGQQAGAVFGNCVGVMAGATSSVWRTTNCGKTWTNEGTVSSTIAGTFGMTALGNSVGLWGTYNSSNTSGTIWRTTNGGTTWTAVLTPSQESCNNFTGLVGLGNNIALAGCTFGNVNPNGRGQIYRSTDNGLTWSMIQIAPSSTVWDVDSFGYFGNGIVLAGTYPEGLVFRSTDYGQTWTSVGSPFGTTPTSTVDSFTSFGNGYGLLTTGIANGSSGTSTVWTTNNYGSTWNSSFIPGNTSTQAFAANVGNGIVVASLYNGEVARSVPFNDTSRIPETQLGGVGSAGQVLTYSTSTDSAVWTTPASGGGSGNGNLFTTPTSSVVAGSVPYYTSNGSSTVNPTSTLTLSATGANNTGTFNTTATSTLLGNVGLGTSTIPDGTNVYAYYAIPGATSTFELGATSTATSTYHAGCLIFPWADVATGTNVTYMDFSATGTVQYSTSTCL